MYRINKQKCTGCQVCIQTCPGATKIGKDGKAEVIDQEKLKECGGESVCPFRAIEKIEEERKSETEVPSQPTPQTPPPYQTPPFSGRGMGAGRGRGLGIGPRDGRGRGRGGGGRGQGRRNW